MEKFKGLTSQKIAERINQGKVNIDTESPTRSNKEIIRRNTMTLFNLLNVLLACMVFFTGSVKNLLFILSVIMNTAVGIYQEIKAKKTIERLNILEQNKVSVIRDNQEQLINKEEIVKDDLLILKKGMQVPVDVICLDNSLMVDESLLTGESDFIEKKVNDLIYSGSLIMQGNAFVRVKEVGANTYVSQLTREAKQFEVPVSRIQAHINQILKLLAIAIIPISVLIIFTQSFFLDVIGAKSAVLGMVAAIVGLMPEGLVLLTSVALAAGVLKLANMKTLTQELPAIETLARVDTICLDKTGTITEGKMSVEEVLYYDNNHEQVEQVLAFFTQQDTEQNMSAVALKERFFTTKASFELVNYIPFSSDIKAQAIELKALGTFILGAFDLIAKEIAPEIQLDIDQYLKKGHRLIGLAHSTGSIQGGQLPKDAQMIALICIKDRVKEDAREIIEYFKSQDVDIKVISGDYPDTIATIAKEVGISGKAISTVDLPEKIEDIQEIVEETSVFGRVTPTQKRDIIRALKANGHTPCMIGDGINDILALKQSDCAVAFASGSEATKAVAQFVLLENDFSSLPNVVLEGRKVINNINTVASLHIVRVVYSLVLPILFFLFKISFPLEPINLTLVGILTVGIPTSLLIFEKNEGKAKDNFFRNIWLNSIPCGIVIGLSLFVIGWLVSGGTYLDEGSGVQYVTHYSMLQGADAYVKTNCTLLIGGVQLFLLFLVCNPLTIFRKLIILFSFVTFFASYFIGPLMSMFGLVKFNKWGDFSIAFTLIIVDIVLIILIRLILLKTVFK